MTIENRFDLLEKAQEMRFVSFDARFASLENRSTTMWVTTMAAVVAGFIAVVVAVLVIG